MKSFLQRADKFWFPEYSATGLAFFRVLLGFLFVNHLVKAEMVGLIHMDPAQDYFATGFYSPYFEWLKPPSYEVFILLGRACLVFAGTALVGFLTPFSLFAASGIFLYLFLLNRFFYYNHLYLLIIAGFLGAFMPLGKTLSVDSALLRLRGKRPEAAVTSWAARLMQMTLSLIYLASAASKTNRAWLSGDLMKTFFEFGGSSSMDGRFTATPPLKAVSHVPFSFQAALSLAAEYFIAFGLWNRKTRPLALLVGVLFHLAILYTMDVSTFSWQMLACYLFFLCEKDSSIKSKLFSGGP